MNPTVLETMVIRIIGNSTLYHQMLIGAARMTSQYARTITSLGRQIERFGTSIYRAGRGMTLALTLPIGYLATKGVKEFAKFDQAMTETFAKMGKQLPAVRKEMEELAKTLSMSGSVAFSPTELAEGYEQLAGAGLDAARSMKALPVVAKFAQAGAFDIDTSVRLMVGAMSSFGKLSKDPIEFGRNLERFSDVMTSVGNHTTATVEQVARAMAADAAVSAKMYGMELEELAAIIGVFANKGKYAEEAGNLIGRSIKLMAGAFISKRPVWQSMGIDLVDKATGKWVKFADAIEMLEKLLVGMEGPQQMETLLKLGFTKLTMKALTPLLGMSKELRLQTQLYKQAGTTAEMAAIQMESFSNQVKVTWNHVKVLAIEIGEILAPYIKQLGEYVEQLVTYWRSISLEQKQNILIVAGLVAAIGPLLIVLGSLVTVLGKLLVAYAVLRAFSPVLILLFGKVVLALLALYATYKLFEMVGHLAGGVHEFNAALEKTILLSNQLDSVLGRRRTADLNQIMKIEDPVKRVEALKKAIATTEKEITGYKEHVKGVESDIKDLSGFWKVLGGKLTGNPDLKKANNDLAEFKNRLQQTQKHLELLRSKLEAESILEAVVPDVVKETHIPVIVDFKVTGRDAVGRASAEAISRIQEYQNLLRGIPTGSGNGKNNKTPQGPFAMPPGLKGSQPNGPGLENNDVDDDLTAIGGFLHQLVILAQGESKRPVVALNPSNLMDS